MSEGSWDTVTQQQVWAQLEALAEGYEQAQGVRPNRLSLGERAVAWLEPRTPGDRHPRHTQWWSPTAGVWFPAQPKKPTFVRAWRCWRQNGGHWWHPVHGGMIDWFCCRCGQVRDGMPKDGTSGW